ncbi:BLUF domain-containing protein [Ekhidna sp.]|uniref:BLUF domain-containing protein n=1 Tax=Ekhidna sp. TaxID=2608089 RepID=UPI003B5BFF84
MIYYLIYTSQPTIPMTEEVLEDITQISIRNNEKTGITGLLLGIENKYMQYLEGGQQEVDKLYETLKKDTRHRELVRWVTGYIEERVFSDWAMASWMLSKEKLESLSALSDLKKFLQDPKQNKIQPKRFIALMNGLLKTWIADQSD